MIQITPQMRVLVAIEPADFRRGIDGLARMCRDKLSADPMSGVVFVFRNRRATAIKILVYDGHGFYLILKRLSRGRFHWWPRSQEVAKHFEAHELQVLLAGGNPAVVKTPEPWRRVRA